jgi:hypothetical protein
MKTGSGETLRPVLHLNSCWKKLQSAAVDDFWVFPYQQNTIRYILVLAQKYMQFQRRLVLLR